MKSFDSYLKNLGGDGGLSYETKSISFENFLSLLSAIWTQGKCSLLERAKAATHSNPSETVLRVKPNRKKAEASAIYCLKQMAKTIRKRIEGLVSFSSHRQIRN